MTRDKILSMLGLAAKAGKLVSGEFSVENTVKGNKAYLVIIAGDASDNTKKKFFNMCEFYRTPAYVHSDKEALGFSIGKQFRAMVGITDQEFAKAIEKYLITKCDSANAENRDGGDIIGRNI